MGSTLEPDVYATALLPYRDPSTAGILPGTRRHPQLGRYSIPDRPGAGTPFDQINVKMTPVEILNGRSLMSKGEVFTLDKQCIDFRTHTSAVKNWEDTDEVMRVYFPEVEALVRASVPGAEHPDAKVLVFNHTLRTGGSGGGQSSTNYIRSAPKEGWGGYGANVHSDNTVRSLHGRVKDQILGSTEVVDFYGSYPSGWGDIRPTPEWRERLFRAEGEDHESLEGTGGEHVIVNIWRPLAPVENWGLGLLDARSLKQGDVHPTALQPVGERFNELFTPLHDAAHRWIYFPDMRPEEVLLFKIQDSRRDGRSRCGAHTAFRDPLGVPNAHRSSIEVRTLVLLPPSGKSPASKL